MRNYELKSTIIGHLFFSNVKFNEEKLSSEFEKYITSDMQLNHSKFKLASYQRNYKWSGTILVEFFNDITRLQKPGYNFGFVTLSKEDDSLEIIDGQQRITTIYIILLALYTFAIENGISKVDIIKLNNIIFNDNNTSIFLSETSNTVLQVSKLYELVRENKLDEINKKEGIVFKNFKTVYEKITKLKKSTSYNYFQFITNIVDVILNQEIILLTYNNTQSAINSFISLNMKSLNLDTYEVTSAYFLEDLNKNQYDEIKILLNDIYDDFIELSSVLQTSKDFEKYLLNLEIAKKYENYSEVPKDVNKLKFSMSDNYIKDQGLSYSEKKDYLNELLTINKIYKFFYLKDNNEFTNYVLNLTNSDEDVELKLKYIDFLIRGLKVDLSKDKLKFNNLFMHLNRYLMSLLVPCEINEISSKLNKIIETLILFHFINIRGYDYENARIELSKKIFKNPKELLDLCLNVSVN